MLLRSAQDIRLGVRGKILGLMIGLIVIFLILLSAHHLFRDKKILQQQLDRRVDILKSSLLNRSKQTSESLALFTENSMATFDLNNISLILNASITSNEELDYAILMDKARKPHINTMFPLGDKKILNRQEDHHAANQTLPAVNEYNNGNKTYLEFIIPIKVINEFWGWLRLGYTMDPVHDEIQLTAEEIHKQTGNTIRNTIITILFFTFLSSIIVLLVANRLAKPIISLTDLALELAKGNFKATTDFNIDSKDEIGILASALKKMSENLQDSYENLSEYSQGLEVSVSTRTAELSKANKKLHEEIIERKSIEKALEKARNELEDRVKERTTSLEEAYSQLQEEVIKRKEEEKERQRIEIQALAQAKLASLGEIATGIAHEINQPLSFIKIIFEATVGDINQNRCELAALVDDCSEALTQVDRITTIIDHLRIFGRDESFWFENINIPDIIDNTLILIRQRLKLKNIDFQLHIADQLPPIFGNATRLEQLFINLFQNSIDALKKQDQAKIEVSITADDDSVIVLFGDNGYGVPSAIRAKIFEPFFTTKEVGKGTGLGLSIVFGIIQEHKGIIEFEPAQEGACFRIILPFA